MVPPVLPRRLMPFAASILVSLSPAAAATIDLRSCPLDTLVFVDPWAGGSFTVERVGTNYIYLCDDGEWRPDETCRGPFGSLVLEGVARDSEDDASGETMFATYSVIKGAPCCDWDVTSSAEGTLSEGFAWLEGPDVPTLGEQSWLSIDAQYGEDFGNPVFVVACTAPD